MCGRYSLTSRPAELIDWLGVILNSNLQPSWNIAPTMAVPVVTQERGQRVWTAMRWGLVPPWAKRLNDGPLLINARMETVTQKPAFKGAVAQHRCLVPADGFYEWHPAKDAPKQRSKQPYRICRTDQKPIAFAGIFTEWHAPDGETLHSMAILTMAASDKLKPIHHRMPVMLQQESFAPWLAPGNAQQALAAVKILPDEMLDLYPVSRAVNAIRNDEPACHKRLNTAEIGPAQGSLF